MRTRQRRSVGARELGAAACFLASVLLGAWALPDAWSSGAVVGLGAGLLVAGFVHLLAGDRAGAEHLDTAGELTTISLARAAAPRGSVDRRDPAHA